MRFELSAIVSSATLSPMFALLLAACGGPNEAPVDGLDAGYTECGDTTCGPGQYCFGDGVCENGCTSDANCLPDDECIIDDDFFDEGTCQPIDGGPVDGGDPLAACQSACEDFQACGLSPAETAGCIDDCVDITETQQQVIGNCGGQSCGSTLECLDMECFIDDDCGGNQQCVGNLCL